MKKKTKKIIIRERERERERERVKLTYDLKNVYLLHLVIFLFFKNNTRYNLNPNMRVIVIIF